LSLFRKILFPFSIVYDGVTFFRNVFFNKGIFKSTQFDLPIIIVGNLSVGGTGKTPHIEYLIHLLKDDYKIAVLSRGYKRKSKGFLLGNENANVFDLGDEPFQYYSKFSNIYVAVDEDRVHGINELRTLEAPPQIVLLDDAYQHRKVNSKFNVLLTSYGELYTDDLVLPAGNLRENKRGAKRAAIVVVTKCPNVLSEIEKQLIKQKLKLEKYQELFFSKVSYSDIIKNKYERIPVNSLLAHNIILVTGIAKSQPMVDFLNSKNLNVKHLKYADHHNFLEEEIDQIKREFESINSENKLILTTEKDYSRLRERLDIYYLEIKIDFFDKRNRFDSLVKTYVDSKI
jgi:tetraacyldisaccharide 4'-kinase